VTSLLDLPLGRARDQVRSGAPVVLCVNPLEYHGPHLSARNDALMAEGLARLLIDAFREAGQDWPWLFAGEVGVGVDPVKGPGTVLTSYADVRRQILSHCQRIHEMGAQRVVLSTFHGSPLHNIAVDEGARWLAARGVRVFSPMNLLLGELMEVTAERVPDAVACVCEPADRDAVAQRLPYDIHAGFLETSLALLLAPDTVGDHRSVPPCPQLQPKAGPLRGARMASAVGLAGLSAELAFMARGLAWSGLRPFPGYSGAPHLASVEAGRALVDQLMPTMLAAADGCLLGEASNPPPALGWVGPATLWGRIPRTTAQVEDADRRPG
jgi:creatinine amidohydrolase